MTTDIVTGTPSIVGFTSGNHHDYHGYRGNYGINTKDQMFASSIDAGERTRDVLHAIRDTSVAIEKTGAANSLATEKVGAGAILATEKIGAAAMLAAEKIGTASVMATHDQAHLIALQVCDVKSSLLLELEKCCCEMGKQVADVKATVLSVDANRIRDDLAQTRAELLSLRSCCSNGNGHGNGSGNNGH